MLYNNPIGDIIFTCSNCGKVFKQGNMLCAVMHYGHGCCHYGDTEVIVVKPKPTPKPKDEENNERR